MDKVNVLYEDKKKEIYSYYLGYSGINNENIIEINDLIIDKKIRKEELDNELLEFYITVSMCLFMVENDLYDEYFFKTYIELLDEYRSGKFDNYFKDIISDKQNLESDIDNISDYLKKEEIKAMYYDNVSDIYNSEFEKFENMVDKMDE